MRTGTPRSRPWSSRSGVARRSTTRASSRPDSSRVRSTTAAPLLGRWMRERGAVSEFLQQLVNGITWGSVYALIALGYTMVYGILRLINFAHGDVYMLGAFFAYFAARFLGASTNPSPFRAVLVLISAMVGCGIIGFFI